MNLRDYSEIWADQVLVLKKPATIASAKSHVRKMDELGPLPLGEITESIIQNHIVKISRSLSPRATRNYWTTLRLILIRAKKDGYIQSVPDPVLPKPMIRPQSYLTLEEMKKLARMDLMWWVLAETGLRVGEVFGLKTPDIDFANRTLTVNRSIFNGEEQPPKSSNAYRTISLSHRLADRLRQTPPGNNYIFETRNRTPRRQTQELRRLNRIRPGYGFHAFRRGNATALAELGCPIKIISARHGRSTGNLTVDSYIQFKPGSDGIWAEKLGKLILD